MTYDDPTYRTRSYARSIYGALIPFPLSCFALALLTDLAYWKTDAVSWETFSVWLLALGLIIAGLAVIGGVLDLVRSRRHRGLGQSWSTVVCQFVAVSLAFVNVLVHGRDGYTAVVPEGLVLSALTMIAILAGLMLDQPRVRTPDARGIA